MQYVFFLVVGCQQTHRIPDLKSIEEDALLGNTPLWFGGLSCCVQLRSAILTAYSIEWSLTTGFPASDQFLKKFADAQKRAFSKGAGWLVSDLKNGESQFS